MTRFRPCIDLHEGRVKQIVGSSLSDSGAALKTNFVSDRDAASFAALYRADDLRGGHVIMLNAGNEAAARAALAAFPGGLQIGGGITADKAAAWLEAGASHVIVTSWLFDKQGRFQAGNLEALVAAVGTERLVIDLSCKATSGGWTVAMNRWQTLTDLAVDHATLDHLASHCAEFLIHAVDVEGKCQGIDPALVTHLGAWGKLPVTYAGGARSLEDLRRVEELSAGRVDVTIGSALDIFGGAGVTYRECVEFNRRVCRSDGHETSLAPDV
ncbi:MAG: phosphoribosylformimino-5-aminoimidazole carboxamide ribotide isomerase [Verrucomicrobiaceae bacterium]|nr:phosphoribosylformimino-5-aminoimidazole carboxamide ribotide isomerase [Verrucomicrobiaceae bacterium]